MVARVDDRMLEEWVTVVTYDRLDGTYLERYGGWVDRLEVGFPIEGEADREALRAVVGARAADRGRSREATVTQGSGHE